MNDSEFESAVAEGIAALKNARERLKNNPLRPPDWEKITPEPLKPAIEHIRKEFRTSEWKLRSRIECGCYFSLHPELATQPTFKGGQNLIPVERRLIWQVHYQGMRESECFAYWTEQFSEILEQEIILPFNSLLKIGLAQQGRLELPPVKWA